MAPHLGITERRHGDVVVLSLSGWLVAAEQDPALRDRVDALVRAGITRIVVDLREVTLLDSGGVGLLVAKYLTLRRAGGDLRLSGLTNRSRRVLSIAKLLTVFASYASVDEAIESFERRPAPAAVGQSRRGEYLH